MKEYKPKVTAVILAAGSGSRMNLGITKQKITLLGESILHRSVRVFASCSEINNIVVACRSDEIEWVRSELADISTPLTVISGGKTRAESAARAFSIIPDDCDFIAIHDAARCLITEENISRVIHSAFTHGAATAGSPVTDTIKFSRDGFICSTVPREELFIAHTPQVFSRELYARAMNSARPDMIYTDDNMLVEQIGVSVCPVDTGKNNIKITTAEDLTHAEYILLGGREMNEIRVGHGYDVHRLVTERKLILGGVEIPHEKGLLGHSDADVLTHAIMDAILGACALGDIGRHFPDTSGEYKDISSLELLSRVNKIIKNADYSIINIDATVVLQKPKVAAYIDGMINNISQILVLDCGRINIKATTEEKLGFTGSEEGVSAHAVVTVKKG